MRTRFALAAAGAGIASAAFAALVATLLAAGAASRPDLVECAAVQARERPRDPWIVRGDVAGIESALEVALAADLTLVYDPRTCSLLRAWCARDAKSAPADAL